ncbi:hypothetical protein ACFYWS_20440 [Streptomyces sp. NPDC002795]|uniref:hypothetical protein n=1 Tax=Streptomyces sp. NPDC002795 TaxID=3364665 RepID=UPI0036B7E68A
MGLRTLVVDAWSWLNYKPVMVEPDRPVNRRVFPELANQWVPDDELRRLAAYKLLAAYDSNQAGQLAAVAGDDKAAQRRELGDPAKLIDTALGYLLGSEQSIVVPGAEHAEDDDPTPDVLQAADLQERLREWADKELLPLRVQQAERCAVRAGDGVYTLAWDPAKQRALLRTFDPGFYFPEWDEGEQDAQEYPTRVHFAWELPEDTRRGLKPRVRRITYELAPIRPATTPATAPDGAPYRDILIAEDGSWLLTTGDSIDPYSGHITRTYPWAPGKPSTVACYLTDGEWLLDDLKGSHDVYNLPADKARYRVRSDGEVLHGLDLMVDFIPVVHVPNSIPDGGEHWGKSTLATVLQLLDELAATDTDSASASATTGTPIIGLAGARLPVDRATGQPLPVAVEAGTVWQLADGGSMSTLNTAPQLAELRSRVDHLIDRIAGNSRLTTAGLGTLDPSAVPSGYALQLALGPLDALVASMRLARDHKYKLLLRMVQRIHQAGQVWPAGETLPAQLAWGPHTPTDRTAILDEATKGYTANVFTPGDRRTDAAGRRIPHRGRQRRDRGHPVPRLRRRSPPRRRHRRQRGRTRLPRTARSGPRAPGSTARADARHPGGARRGRLNRQRPVLLQGVHHPHEMVQRADTIRAPPPRGEVQVLGGPGEFEQRLQLVGLTPLGDPHPAGCDREPDRHVAQPEHEGQGRSTVGQLLGGLGQLLPPPFTLTFEAFPYGSGRILRDHQAAQARTGNKEREDGGPEPLAGLMASLNPPVAGFEPRYHGQAGHGRREDGGDDGDEESAEPVGHGRQCGRLSDAAGHFREAAPISPPTRSHAPRSRPRAACTAPSSARRTPPGSPRPTPDRGRPGSRTATVVRARSVPTLRAAPPLSAAPPSPRRPDPQTPSRGCA